MSVLALEDPVLLNGWLLEPIAEIHQDRSELLWNETALSRAANVGARPAFTKPRGRRGNDGGLQEPNGIRGQTEDAPPRYRSWADVGERLRDPVGLASMIAMFGRDVDGVWGLQTARDLHDRRLARAAAQDIIDAYGDLEDPRHHKAVIFMVGKQKYSNGRWIIAGCDQGFSGVAI